MLNDQSHHILLYNTQALKTAHTAELRTLEEKVERLEMLVESLIKQQREESIKVDLYNRNDYHQQQLMSRSSARSAVQRTCRETRASDPFLTSGMYWIDPDGQGIGDDPIYVYCDMTTGNFTASDIFVYISSN